MKTHSIFRVFFWLFIISIILLEFPGVRDLIETPYSGIETKNLVVQSIDNDSPNRSKGIAFGDEIYSVNGEKVRNLNHYRFLVKQDSQFAPQVYEFKRGSEKVRVEVAYTDVPQRVVKNKFKLLIVAFMFLLMGAFVYIRKADLLGTLFSFNCAIFAFFLTDRPIVAQPFLQLFGELFHDAIMLVFPAVFLRFILVFPDRYTPDGISKEKRRTLPIYLPFFILFLLDCYLVIRHFFYAPADQMLMKGILGVSTFYTAAYLLASLVIFIRNYRSSPKAQKVRIRIVIAGTIAGIVPFLITIVLRQISPGAWSWWDIFSAIALGFIPVSFAYAILKHGAIELNLVVKKSIVYAFLTGGIIAVYYALVNVLGDYFTREFKLSQSLFSVLSVLIIAVVFAPARGFLQRLVDRLFYVGDYVYKQEVVKFNRSLSGKLSKKEIIDCFYNKVDSLLKASHVAVYLKGSGGDLDVQRQYGEVPALPKSLSGGCYLCKYLVHSAKSLMVEYIDQAWQKQHFDEESIEFLEHSKAAVCLALTSHDAFLGMIILGGKRSGLLYKRADAELLETFAERLGLVLENAELHESSIEQERLKNEVMLARDIQISLLPKSPPKVKSFDILGKMKSSSEVGGDYHDYFMLEENKVGIVLGDVSGNGIPAAMLVFSLQAVFKNLAIKEKLSPAELNAELNNYLCSNAKPDQFATFFYGILNAANSTFTFSNAGQHPALLMKKDYADRLGEGGMLLGVEPGHIYQEGSVKLDSGDLLCLYTDGIVEQKNSSGEEYGESRLIEFLKENKHLPLPELTESLFATVLTFGNGKQDDDLSCIIVYNNMT